MSDPESPDLDLARRCAERLLDSDEASKRLGISISVTAAGQAVAVMSVRDDMLNGFGICHGGYIFTLADTAFAFACNAYNDVTVAAAGSIEYLQPVHGGDRLEASAVEDYREGRRGFYTVTVARGESDVVALFRGRSTSRSEPLLK
ncbi:MAG: hydroxyphenylacetyl-CoA thioesterase PaaI [Woeseiaceae bacterium]|nr:hydroxyphenylacetyl-CoA thioesterase PaaI [Woeseiaceae bacterium]